MREGAVQTITLNRPDVMNAFNSALHAGLRDALKEARDPEVRAVVITGAGRGFCAGQGDLTELRSDARRRRQPAGDVPPEHVLAIRALEKPVIAAVNGACAGAGLSLACACDIRIAVRRAAFFVPGFIGIGPRARFRRDVLHPPSARRAARVRVDVFQPSPDRGGRRMRGVSSRRWSRRTCAFAARTAELAATYAALPTLAVGMTKRLFDHADDATLEEQLELEAQLQAAAAATADFREGVAAFVEKRPASFSGS